MMAFGGPLTGHMIAHILLMNAAAPLAVLVLRPVLSRSAFRKGRPRLAAATMVQLALLWVWHSPRLLQLSLDLPAVGLLMAASLMAAALWFWSAVLAAVGAARWKAIFALLITAKLFCLLGALLVFAPRLLYPELLSTHPVGVDAALADQHLAGLLMLAACPLTYVAAGVLIAARWVFELEASAPKLFHDAPAEAASK